MTVPCLLMGKRKRVVDDKGQEVVSSQQALLGTVALIQPTARVTLSTADAGSTDASMTQPTILAVERRYDDVGLHHSVLFFR